MIDPDKLYTITDLTRMRVFPWLTDSGIETKIYRKYQNEVNTDRRKENILASITIGKVTIIRGDKLATYITKKIENVEQEKTQTKKLLKKIKKIV